MSAHTMLYQKDNCVRSLERKSKSVPESDEKVVRKQAKCPKCGHINNTDSQTECPKCSIIYSQYQLVVKKAFNNTLAVISRNGLETAEAEFNALAARYPSIKATCDQYSAFINHAIKKHLAGNRELSRGYFDKLVNKQPVLKDAVAKFLKKKEEDGNKTESDSSELLENVEQKCSAISIIRTHINKNGVLVSCGLLLFMIVTTMIANKDDHAASDYNKYSTDKITPANKKIIAPATNPVAAGYTEISNKDDHAASDYNKYSTDRITPANKKITAPATNPVVAGYTETFLLLMNKYYGNICKIEVHGIFSRTLKVDWTPNTNKLHMFKVFAEIGDAKFLLYEEGVRYFQFPNNLCRYNVIDWKTGEKESISDWAPYCFTD